MLFDYSSPTLKLNLEYDKSRNSPQVYYTYFETAIWYLIHRYVVRELVNEVARNQDRFSLGGLLPFNPHVYARRSVFVEITVHNSPLNVGDSGANSSAKRMNIAKLHIIRKMRANMSGVFMSQLI